MVACLLLFLFFKRFYLGANLYNINRIIITEALHVRMLSVGVLPCLRKAAVVPEDRAVIITEVALLYILGDWIIRFFRRNLEDLWDGTQESEV